MLNFATELQATEHGATTGESDGETLYSENHEGYRDESHAVSGLDACASEAASVLRVPRDFYVAWCRAYEESSREVIRRLYRADNS